MKRCIPVLIALAVLVPATAHAGLYKDAKKAFDNGDLKTAIEKIFESARTDDGSKGSDVYELMEQVVRQAISYFPTNPEYRRMILSRFNALPAVPMGKIERRPSLKQAIDAVRQTGGGVSRPAPQVSTPVVPPGVSSTPAVVLPAPPRQPSRRLPPAAPTSPAPQPARILFEVEQQEIPSHKREVPLSIKLTDQNGVLIATLDRERRIRLSSPTDAEVVSFEPETLILTPNRLSAQSVLRLKGLPATGQISLQAKDLEGYLKTGEKIISLKSQIQKVMINGPGEVNSGGKEYDITVQLEGKKKGEFLNADWDRKIMVSADYGKVMPREAKIAKGQGEIIVKYWSPSSVRSSVRQDTIRGRSPGLETGALGVKVVTAAYVLVLFAGLGGTLGGLVRQVYKMRVKQILPKWVGGYLDIGLVGNAVFSFVFGLVLFQAAKLGGVEILGSLTQMEGSYGETRTFAFFFGVLGGFGSIVVLDRLLDRVFPAENRGEAHSSNS